MTHTAAPWLIYDRLEGHEIGYRAIIDADGFTVCNPSPMGEANARLIAAAPDLLDALYRALPFVEDAKTDPAYKTGYAARIERVIKELIERIEQ